MEYFIHYKAALAKNIKAIRIDKGISVEKAAMVLNMSRANYYKIESGEQSVKGEWILPLQSLLEVSIDELFTGRPGRKISRLESQIRDYLKEGSEEELSMWLGLISIAFRKKITAKQYKHLIELVGCMNDIAAKHE